MTPYFRAMLPEILATAYLVVGDIPRSGIAFAATCRRACIETATTLWFLNSSVTAVGIDGVLLVNEGTDVVDGEA